MGPCLARLEALRQREAEALDAERRAASAEARLAEKDPWQFFGRTPGPPPRCKYGWSFRCTVCGISLYTQGMYIWMHAYMHVHKDVCVHIDTYIFG